MSITAARDMNRGVGISGFHGRGEIAGLWPEGKIFYELDTNLPVLLINMITRAIGEFHAKTPVRWLPKDCNSEYWVRFKFADSGNPRAHVGCLYRQPQMIWLPLTYPGGTPVRHICVLHEMCHCIGLGHEHARVDRDSHIKCDADGLEARSGVRFGNYDYYSIMHYGHGSGNVCAKSEELRERADTGETFSAGDLAVIKKLYQGRFAHHGDWHRPCSSQCSETSCQCGACGSLHGGVNCGYQGMKGHWTCCMSEIQSSRCTTTHTGFWHARCDSSKGCTSTVCRCNNCGGGCTYEGNRGHWSCCRSEDFGSVCPFSPFQNES